ncbi:hypothetical protein G7Y41_09635 [Schaalia sp. ZJ405]|nr:hypothetical protein G7Y41_09635 [Schaalia sp. ZJ405]
MNTTTHDMARYLAKHGVIVNTVCPTTTYTAILDGYAPERIEHQAK